MKFYVVNMSTGSRIEVRTRDEGRALADDLSINTPYLWFLMMAAE